MRGVVKGTIPQLNLNTMQGNIVEDRCLNTSKVPGLETAPTTIGMGQSMLERSMMELNNLVVFKVHPIPKSIDERKRRFVLYGIYIQNAITGRCWIVKRRYSDFMHFKSLVDDHFQNYGYLFPGVEQGINELYFPPKKTLHSASLKVVQHRAAAFLDYLVNVHQYITCVEYCYRKTVASLGMSILRGFLGSTFVSEVDHRIHYQSPHPVSRMEMLQMERFPVSQCGSLTTIIEETIETHYYDNDTNDPYGELRCPKTQSTASSDEGTTMLDELDLEDLSFDLVIDMEPVDMLMEIDDILEEEPDRESDEIIILKKNTSWREKLRASKRLLHRKR